MIASTVQKLVLVLLGTTLLASVSFGGWKIWSQLETNEPATVIVPSTANTYAETLTPVIEPMTEKPAYTAPKAEKTPPQKAEPIHTVDVRKAESPKGKKHAKQDELLAAMAQRLHAEAFQHFINQPGMGMRRMMPTMSIMPREWKIPDWTSEEITKEQPPLKGMKDLSMIHRLSLNQFTASNTGTAKTPSLGFGKEPDKKEQLWEIHSLDLVGLVMHDTAKVYVSAKLPKMKDLKTTPIRDLDVFESEGLEELMNGKDLYVRSKDETVRVLGPIRAGQACLQCHGDAKEGVMLGAFSYTLRPGQYRMAGFNGGLPGNLLPNPNASQLQP